MKVIYMGTSEFAVPPLRALVEHGEEIAFVVTQPDRIRGRGKAIIPTPVKQYADSVGLKVEQPETIEGNADFLSALEKADADLIVVASYGKLLPPEVLKSPRSGCINIHASILPKLRGAAPIQWAIAGGDKLTGVTLMYMSEGLDCGDIGACETVEIGDRNAGELEKILSDLGARLLIDNLEKIKDGTMVRIPQDKALSTYARMLKKEDAHIDLTLQSKKVINMINAMNPVPGSYVNYFDIKMKIKKAYIKNVDEIEMTKAMYEEQCVGSIIKVSNDGIEVKLHDGVLVIEEIGMPGKKPMKVGDYLRGNKIDTSFPLN